MIRALGYLIATLLVVAIVRSILQIILKGFADLFNSGQSAQQQPTRPPTPIGGELKKDPVCGTFISTATAIQKRIGGETYYFCSPECRAKYESIVLRLKQKFEGFN